MAKKSVTPGASPVGKPNMSGKGSTPTVKPMAQVKGGKKTTMGTQWGGGSK